jgi:hypothetical protein
MKKVNESGAKSSAGADTNQTRKPGASAKRIIGVRLPKSWLPLIDKAAKFKGESREEFIIDAVRAKNEATADDIEDDRKGLQKDADKAAVAKRSPQLSRVIRFHPPGSGCKPLTEKELKPNEVKVVVVRECAPINEANLCANAASAVEYWKANIATNSMFNGDCEFLAAILLNGRMRALGHAIVSIGIVDTILFHARETFRAAVASAASSIILMHNHPSGDPSPSWTDVKVTASARQAGKILGIEVLDHVIAGAGKYASLRELGYFA